MHLSLAEVEAAKLACTENGSLDRHYDVSTPLRGESPRQNHRCFSDSEHRTTRNQGSNSLALARLFRVLIISGSARSLGGTVS